MKPVVVLSNVKQQCATIFWKENPDFYIGYRFIEHQPETLPTPLPGIQTLPAAVPAPIPDHGNTVLGVKEGDPWSKGWMTSHVENDAGNGSTLGFTTSSGGAAFCFSVDRSGDQRREFYFEGTEDGVRLWMRLTTRRQIAGAFCLQQCLRFTGSTNVEWRRQVALAPLLSEFDMQARGKPHETLTFVRRSHEWVRFPLSHTCYYTPPGAPLLGDRSGGGVDHGLIVRESIGGEVCSGMYWERTAYVSNRHPADCVHASVDLGPLDAEGSRTVQGKVYFINGTKNDLLGLWQRDFPVGKR
jgi:hypothetical protein